MEDKQLNVMLEDVLKGEIEKIPDLQAGSKEHSEQVNAVATLYKLNIEEIENERSFQERCERTLDTEREFKLKQDEARSRFWIGVAGVAKDIGIAVGTMIAYGLWMKKGFQFEETGTFTSTTFRNFFGKFKPGK